ncbi:MAG: phosphate-starvation-inducible PsiE family protein [Hydrogenothermaceae bacterium]|nr:phosphate-starvation-inducible PsiE family protein [Hydrogenothermaceae bacterium]
MEKLNILVKINILDNVVNLILFLLEIVISVGLFLGLYNLIFTMYQSYPDTKEMFKDFIHHTLSLFVAIEIIKSINDYFKYKRVRVYLMIDISIIIILRELILGIYQHNIHDMFALTLTFIIFLLIIVRVIALKFSPNKYIQE